ncbi:flocculation protein FLO11-like [Lathyrus oleraceus]|uniref:flocculation protein FLO11-like n=1 Tax=Pisum sativum TaxID=3888 RepID=UPI0021D275B4|nr:flocculation protein FLO11-like [Pisum sativum]
MEDVMIDTRRALNAKNLKSMGILDQVRAKPTLDTSWEALKDQRKIPNGLYLFSKIDPPEVILYYLDDLRKQGVDISDFNISQLLDEPPNFMKRPRGPSEKAKQAKKANLGESSGSRPPAPLTGPSGKSVFLAPSIQIHHIASSIPQPTPIYTNSETPPSTTRTSNQPSQKFNLATTTLPVSEAKMLNKITSPSSYSSPESPPYYNISTDTEPSDPPSPTLAQLQTRALASQQPTQSTPEPEVTSSPTAEPTTTTSDPPPSETIHAETQPPNSDIPPPNTSVEPQTPTLNLSPPTSPPQASDLENTLPTLEEAIMMFAEASVDKVKSFGGGLT